MQDIVDELIEHAEEEMAFWEQPIEDHLSHRAAEEIKSLRNQLVTCKNLED